MDEKYDVSERVRVVPVERVTLVSARPFEEDLRVRLGGRAKPPAG
jgi:hypothetical protein